MDFINIENNQTTIELLINKETKFIYVSWDEFICPEGYEEQEIEYTVKLYKNEDKKGETKQTYELDTFFENINLDDANDIAISVDGLIYRRGEETIHCGTQQLTVKIIDGELLMVTGVNASFTDDGDLSVSWNQIDIDNVNYSLKLIGRFINPDGESIGTEEEKLFNNIEVNNITLTQEETRIAAGDPANRDNGLEYKIYVIPHYKETRGTESDVYILYTSEEEYEESFNPEFNIHALKAGDPVNVTTGTFSYNNVDLEIGSDKTGLKFHSFYHSQYNKYSMFYDYKKEGEPENQPDLVMGTAWSHNYMISLLYKDKKVTIYFPDSSSETFKQENKKSKELKIKGTYNGCKLYYTHNKNDEILSRYRYVKKDQTEYIFNNRGQLLEIISPIKNKITLTYNDDNLLELINVENLPYQLKLNYENKKIIEVIGISNSTEQKIKYTYKNDNLTIYTDILGNSRKFDYYSGNKNALMKTAEDQNGTIFVYNEYKPTINHYSINKSGYQVVFQQDADEYARTPENKENGLHFSYEETHANLWPWNWANKTTYTSIVERKWNYKIEGIEMSGSTNTISKANRRGALETEQITVSGDIKTNNYSYDGFNNCIKEWGDTINETYKMYDSELNLIYESENKIPLRGKPKKFINAYKYNSKNQLISHTNQLENTTRYDYKDGNLIKKQYPLNQSEKYEYLDSNVKGLISKYTDQLGNSTKYEYNSELVIQITNQNGTITKFTYEDKKCSWLPTKVTIFEKNNEIPIKTTFYEYNGMGVKLAESIAYNNQAKEQAFKTLYKVDNLNQITLLTDAEGNSTKFTYSPNMQRIKTEYPEVDGLTIEQKIFYDSENNVILESVGNNITKYTYNSINQLTEKVDPNGNVYQYSYSRSNNNQTTNVIYPKLDNGVEVKTIRILDRFYRPIKVVTRMGQEICFKYKVNKGQLTTTTEYQKKNNDDIESTVSQTQDELGRVIKSCNQEYNITTYEYYTKEYGMEYVSVTTKTNPLGIKTVTKTNANKTEIYNKTGEEEYSYKYDELNRIIETQQKINATKSLISLYKYEYDVKSNTMQTTFSQNGEKISVSSYNGLNQLVLVQNEQNVAKREFNSRGQLGKYIMLNANLEVLENSNQITYEYDKVGLNNKTIFSDGNYVVKKYDKNGNNIETNQYLNDSIESSSEVKKFDAWNRVISVTKKQTENSISNVIGYDYNNDNMLTKLVYPSLNQDISVSYKYDNLQRMKSVTDWENRVTTYEYTPTGNVKNTIFPNGVRCENSYDVAQNLKTIKTSKKGTLISLYKATKINDNGYPLEVTELNTLRSNKSGSKNILSYNLANQLETFDGGTKITYDVNGNPTSLPKLEGTISYNDMNLITKYGNDKYKYDAFGLRTQSTIKGVTKNYLFSSNDYTAPYLSILDPLMGTELIQASSIPSISANSPLDQLLQISDENDNLYKRFIYGHGLIAEESESGGYRAYHYNTQGSTIALTNVDGVLTDKYAYSPYGEIIAHEGNNDTGFLYNGSAGVYTDINGLSNMRSRSYRADLMRFVQQDFLLGNEHNPMSLNRYSFVCGNPISFFDPLGMERSNKSSSDWWKWVILGFGIVGLAVGTYAFFYYRKRLKTARLILAYNEEWLGKRLASDYIKKTGLKSKKNIAKWIIEVSFANLLAGLGFVLFDNNN